MPNSWTKYSNGEKRTKNKLVLILNEIVHCHGSYMWDLSKFASRGKKNRMMPANYIETVFLSSLRGWLTQRAQVLYVLIFLKVWHQNFRFCLIWPAIITHIRDRDKKWSFLFGHLFFSQQDKKNAYIKTSWHKLYFFGCFYFCIGSLFTGLELFIHFMFIVKEYTHASGQKYVAQHRHTP